MTKYANAGFYTSDQLYQGNDGVYQRPTARQNIVVSANTSRPLLSSCLSSWAGLATVDGECSVEWLYAQHASFDSVFVWGRPYATSQQCLMPYGLLGAGLHYTVAFDWIASLAVGPSFLSAWNEASKVKLVDVAVSWLKSSQADAVVASGFLTISHRYESEFYDSDYPYSSFWTYQLKRRALALGGLSVVGWGGYAANQNDSHVPWGGGFTVWGVDTELEWTEDITPLPDQPAPPQPDIKEFYGMATDLTVTDVATRTALDVDDIVISLDIDSIAWSLKARVNNRASMDLAAPGRLIEITTVGWTWVFLVSDYSRVRGVATEWSINAASQSCVLDGFDKSSYVEESVITWKQAVESMLPPDWSVTFDSRLIDYVLPAGSWSYVDKTPKEALSDLLDALSAVVVPDLSGKVLHVQSRYKYAPWEYDLITTEPDTVLHEAMIFGESGKYHSAALHNGVWVSGTSRHGVIVHVEREGTNGLPVAPDVYHDLVTDVDAGRQKGKQLLAASGNKTLETIETIVTDEQASPGLMLPGSLVEVHSDGLVWRGVCLSVSISGAGMPAITQTVVVEKHNGNND